MRLIGCCNSRAQLLVLAGTLLLALPSEAYSPSPAAKRGGRFYPPAEAAALIETGACEERSQPGTPICFFFFFTLVTGPRSSLSLKLSDTRVYAPQRTSPPRNHCTFL